MVNKLPITYLYIDKDANLYQKGYCEKKTPETLNPYTLGSIPVVFSKDATVNTLFELVKKSKVLQKICFYADEFLREASHQSKEEVKGKLRFYWEELEVNSDYVVTDYPKLNVDGVDEDGTNFGIDFLKACDIKNLVLEFDPIKHVIDSKGNILYKTRVWGTLFQVIYGLFWELSFHGNPEARDQKGNELREILENVQNGTEELIPFEFNDIEDAIK